MEDRQELISVIMPAYNAEKTLLQAIVSVLEQSYRNIELVIIDDDSKDNTRRIAEECAEKDCRVKVLHNLKNCGVSITRHRGIAAANGKWIAFLDSDDIWKKDKLEKQWAIRNEKGADLVFSGSAFIDAEGNQKDWVLHVPEKISYRELLKQNVISNSSVLIKKTAYQRCEILGNNMHEDFACWLNFLRKGGIACGIDEPLLIYRLSPNSKSGNKVKAARMNWNTYRAIGLNFYDACWYEIHYAFNGLRKYRHLKREN